MPPTPQQAAQAQMQQQMLQQLQQNLTPDQRQSLNSYILSRQQAQPGANATFLFQEWLKLNNLLPGSRQQQQQPTTQQQQQFQQQQQAAQGMQAQQQQQQQGRPPLQAGAQQAAQAVIGLVFPAHLMGNRAGMIQHLRATLYRPNGTGGLATAPLLGQVVALAKNKQLDSQQLDLLRQVLPQSSSLPGRAQSPQAGGAPTPPPFTPQNGLPQQAPRPPQSATPSAPGTPQPNQLATLHAQAQALGNRIQQLEQLIKRPDLSQDQRDKALQQCDMARDSLGKVLPAIRALSVSRQGTPGPGQGPGQGQQGMQQAQQPQQQQPQTPQQQVNGTPAGQHVRQPSNLGPGGVGGAQAAGQQTPLRGATPGQFGQQQGSLAFGGGTPGQTMLGQTNGIQPGATTIAPSALQGSAAPTRAGTPAAAAGAGMAMTPSGGNLSVGGTPTASGAGVAPAGGTGAAATTAAPAAAGSAPGAAAGATAGTGAGTANGAAAAASVVAAPVERVLSDPRPDSEGRTVSKRKLRELLASIDDDDRLTDEAEDLLQDVADDFLNSITTFACQLAKHRKSERLEVKDIAFHLERTYGMKVPGFFAESETARPSQGPRRGNNLPAFQARLSAIQAGEGGAKRVAR